MRTIALLLLGLLIVVSVSAGCGEEEVSEPLAEQAEQLAQSSSGDQQADTPRQPDAQPQPSQQAAIEERGLDDHQPPEEAIEDDPPPEEQQQQATPEAPPTKFRIGETRRATLIIPEYADLAEPRPLILLLHGYGSNSLQANSYFRFDEWVDTGGFGLLAPDGTVDAIGARHWNGTDECCDIFGAEIDDVAYLKSLIEEAREIAEFDQVFAVGHSNGGFMSYRLACEDVSGLTAIVSLAGGAHSDAASCRVPKPLSVLQIHGTEDALVLYEGGRLPTHPDPHRRPVPSAKGSVLRWAERAGCDIEAAEQRPRIDTDSAVEGDETTVWRWTSKCADGVVTELWTLEGGGHVPLVWDTDFTPGILDWIEDRYEQAKVSASEVQERVLGGARTARLQFPPGTEGEAIPLVLSLHGYSGEADAHDWYFGLSERILEYRFALITPQGTTDSRGNAFWNATDGCCNFEGSDVDDSAWLRGLVAEAREILDVSGVYVTGYSNGGFMAYRLACDGLDGLVAIASLAGSSFGDVERCADAAPIAVLQIHGTDDLDIPYAGTLEYAGGYPGAVELTERWAERAGCDATAVEELAGIDLDAQIDGAETKVQRIREGCSEGITVELWTIEGADHYPFFSDDWPDRLLTWLFNDSRTN